MSTPTGRPVRPASAFDYAPKRVREQWSRDDADDGADAESADHQPRDLDEDRAPAPSGHREEERSSLVPQGPHERAEDDWEETEDAPALGWEDEPEHSGDAHDRHAESAASDDTDDERYEEPSQEAHQPRYREQGSDPYDEHLERLAATMRSLKPEASVVAPKLPPAPQIGPATRGFHAADAADRDVYIDGTRLPRFLQASYAPPPNRREGGVGPAGALLAVGVAILVAAPLTYYVAFGNPFASATPDIGARPTLQYAVASTSTSLPRPEPQGPEAASIVAPNAPVATAAPQPAPQQLTAVRPIEPQVQAPASPRAPRPVPLTHVMRWPDAAQDSGAATQPPRLPSVAPAAGPPHANAAAEPAPSVAGPVLALAPATAPAPAPPPAIPQLPTRDADEIGLLLKQGQEFVAAGDIATARIVLRRAAEAGAAAAALALGQTYEPKVLTKMRAFGVAADVGEARRWYETAQRLGSREAAQRLERLARDE